MVGHLIVHEGGGIDAGEDESLLKSGIEATVFRMREPDEIRDTVVGSDTVEVVYFIAMSGLRSNPCECHEHVTGLTTCLPDRKVVLSSSAAIGSVDGIVAGFDRTQAVAGERKELCVTRTVDGFAFSSLEWAETEFGTVCKK